MVCFFVYSTLICFGEVSFVRKNRDRVRIVADLLEAAGSGSGKTKIMFGANLSFKLLEGSVKFSRVCSPCKLSRDTIIYHFLVASITFSCKTFVSLTSYRD